MKTKEEVIREVWDINNPMSFEKLAEMIVSPSEILELMEAYAKEIHMEYEDLLPKKEYTEWSRQEIMTDDRRLQHLIKLGKPIRGQRFILKEVVHIEGDIKHCIFKAPTGTSIGAGVDYCVLIAE